ncbi:hypothetical protein Tco_1321892, partial [Tanacetum coccineum]
LLRILLDQKFATIDDYKRKNGGVNSVMGGLGMT